MEDGASEFSDWEVLSAASSTGGDVGGLLVSGEGGGVFHDHFALPPGFPAEGPWPEPVSDGGEAVGLELLDSLNSINPAGLDRISVVDSTAQSRFGGVDEETGEVHGEMDHEKDAVHSCGESDSILQDVQGVGGILDFDATVATGGFQIEMSQNSSVQSEVGGAEATRESSLIEAAAATRDVMLGAQEEPEQGKDASTASSCGESEGEVKDDGSSPLVEFSDTGNGERQLVVWWRLPFRLLHYFAWEVRPVWSISIAAAFLGLVVLGRRMYKMRRKTRAVPQIKIAFDDKRASQFADRVALLNEAFLIAKRVPALRTSSDGVLPWAMVQER